MHMNSMRILFLEGLVVLCLLGMPYSLYSFSSYSLYQIDRTEDTRNSADDADFNKLGEHIVTEFLECENLNAIDELEEQLRRAAYAANATVLGVETHQFSPVGMSGLVLLQESHISVHTWPEFGYVAIDIFTCGEHVSTDKALASLQGFFKPKKMKTVKLLRGYSEEAIH